MENKKSDIVMTAYTVFLLTSPFIGNLIGEKLIHKIAISITCASLLFAISDCLIGAGTGIQKQMRAISPFMADTIKVLRKIEILDAESRKVVKNHNIALNEFETRMNYIQKTTKRMIKIGNWAFGIGIFLVISLLCLYDENIWLFSRLDKIESELTIFAFGMVTLNYKLQDYLVNKEENLLRN